MQKVLHLVILAGLFLAVATTKVSKPSTSEDHIETIKDDDGTTVSSTNSNNSTRNDEDSNTDIDGETETEEVNTGIERIECLDAFERFMLKTTTFQSQLITKASARFKGKSFSVSGMCIVLLTASLFLNTKDTSPAFREMSDSLGIDKDEGRCVFKTVIDYVTNVLDDTLTIGSVTFGQLTFTEKFKTDVNTYTPGSALTLDIMNNPPLCGDMINKELSEQTDGKILNVITTFKVPEKNTQIGLACGNLLFSRWLYQFEIDLQRKRTFNVSPSLKVKIPYMKQEAPYKFVDNRSLLNAKVVEIPFERKDIALLVVLPNDKNTNMAEISRQFEIPEVYTSVMNSMTKHLVKIYLPPFNMTSYNDLADLMKETRFANTLLNENTIDLDGAFVGDEKAAVTFATEKSSILTTTEGGLIPFTRKLHKASFKAVRPFFFYLKSLSLGGLTLLGGAVMNPADMTITM